MAKKKAKTPDNNITVNRKARHNYTVEDSLEAGIILTGSEVKSLRNGQGNIGESYAIIKDEEIYLMNSHISEYANGGYANHEPTRLRKLLLNRKEIVKLIKEKEQMGMTLIPLKLYWKQGKVKVELGICRGKKAHDKRADNKDRDWKRQQARLLKN